MTPLGVPLVEYKIPGTQRSEFRDIHTRLYRERILFVSQSLDESYTNMIIGTLLCLDSDSNEKPITLYINSQGGPSTAGITLYDTIKHLKSKIATINVGFCSATASLLLASGTPGMRSALPHSRVVMHQPAGTLEGSAEQIRSQAQYMLNMKRILQKLYSQVTNQPLDNIAKDLEHEQFMSAEESLQYGLVDRIIRTDHAK
uniref:ATP-dependent Clp protease proteolytic subunit n=1 Tax=Babesia bovis TaxID=5865 RepID=S6B0K5_BABBO|nr:ATP-dependent Clp protease proteolytic subunit, putative [Babesia bovis]